MPADVGQAAATATPSLSYVGFWMRVVAFVVDSFITLVLMWLVMAVMMPGVDLSNPENARAGGAAVQLVSTLVLAVVVILFWRYRGATPGKMVIGARVADAATGGEPSMGQLIGRYFAYFVSTVPLGLGFLWVAFDARKQGWHDKLSGTVVVYDKRRIDS
jgi:uncharacterized RDD family membrane protein YckC